MACVCWCQVSFRLIEARAINRHAHLCDYWSSRSGLRRIHPFQSRNSLQVRLSVLHVGTRYNRLPDAA